MKMPAVQYCSDRRIKPARNAARVMMPDGAGNVWNQHGYAYYNPILSN
jgi:hypothetical protein